MRGCPGYTRPVSLRSESAPVGAPAAPPASTLFSGLSGQSAAGVRLPVSVRVAASGRVYAIWTATMKCGPKAVVALGDRDAADELKADGSFLDDEPYTVRYTDGSSERYRIRFEGRFLADGVVGTLRVRMQTRKKGKQLLPVRQRHPDLGGTAMRALLAVVACSLSPGTRRRRRAADKRTSGETDAAEPRPTPRRQRDGSTAPGATTSPVHCGRRALPPERWRCPLPGRSCSG